jgi:hypothetical protein
VGVVTTLEQLFSLLLFPHQRKIKCNCSFIAVSVINICVDKHLVTDEIYKNVKIRV